MLNPLTNLLIYTFVFGTILSGARALPENPGGLDSFTHFLFSALVGWTLYTTISTGVINSFGTTVALRKRMYFPATCPAVANTLVLMVGAAIELVVLVVAYLVVGHIGPTFVLLIPLSLLLAVFALGVGLLLAVANARYRDVGYLYGVVIRLLFYLTPIIYPPQLVPDTYLGLPVREIVEYSPFTVFLTAMRRCTFELLWVSPRIWMQLIAYTVVAFGAGWYLFTRHADDVAEGM